MRSIGESLHVGMGGALEEIGEEAIVEHRIAAAPDEQERDTTGAEGGEIGRSSSEGGIGWVRGLEGDVSDEGGDGGTAGGVAVGRVQGPAMSAVCHPRGAAHEQRRSTAGEIDH